jgi:hypothetical protein
MLGVMPPPEPRDFDDPSELPARVIDRLEAAWAEGALRVTPDEYAAIVGALVPEDVGVEAPLDPPERVGPQTPERVAAYQRRARRQEPVFRRDDADASRTREFPRLNGAGLRCVRHDGRDPAEVPEGMYRDESGEWFEVGR